MIVYGTGKKNLPKGQAYEVIPTMAAVLVRNGSASYEKEESMPSETDGKEKAEVTDEVTEKVQVVPTKKKKKNGK